MRGKQNNVCACVCVEGKWTAIKGMRGWLKGEIGCKQMEGDGKGGEIMG